MVVGSVLKDFDDKTNLGVQVCTSTTRPTVYEGRVIYETDTNKVLVYDGAAWSEISGWTETATSNLDMADYNIVNANTIQAKSTNNFRFKCSIGKAFIFEKV
jgi:hypothetical protein